MRCDAPISPEPIPIVRDVVTGKEYVSLSAFALAFIHETNPDRLAIDGWKACRHVKSAKMMDLVRDESYPKP